MSHHLRVLLFRFLLILPGLFVTCSLSWAQTPLNFVPVTACRLVDTRGDVGTFGAPSIAAGTFRNFPIPQSSCSIPPTAAAYSLNFTVVPHGTLGYLTVWPTGLNRPVASTLNSLDGRIKANAAIVPAGRNGAVSTFVTDTTDLVIDINGYFVTDLTQSEFYPLTPCRVLDTRDPNGPLGGPPMIANNEREFPVQRSACNVPSNAQAYSLNFTVVPKTTLGYLTVWPSGGPRPFVSTLNSLNGTVTANAAIVPAGNGGDISAFVTNDTDLIADINGYFAPPAPGGQSLYSAAPCRVLDTRNSSGSGAFSGQLQVNVVEAPCGMPSRANAFVFNATVVPEGPLGYLSLWPNGQNQPLVSTLNALDGAITSNIAIVPSSNGSIDAFTTNTSDLILDVFSYFAAPESVFSPSVGVILGNNGVPLSVQVTSDDSTLLLASADTCWYFFACPPDGGLFTYSLTTPTTPALEGHIHQINPPYQDTTYNQVAYSSVSRTAFIADGLGYLKAFNVANPATPVFEGGTALQCGVLSAMLSVDQTSAYTSDSCGNVSQFNVTDPTNITLTSTVSLRTTSSTCCNFQVSNMALSPDGKQLMVFGSEQRCTIGRCPSYIGIIDVSGGTLGATNVISDSSVISTAPNAAVGFENGTYIGNRTIALLSLYGVTTVDVTTPAEPVVTGAVSFTNSDLTNTNVGYAAYWSKATGRLYIVAPTWTYPCTSCSNAFFVVNASDPVNPYLEGSAALPDSTINSYDFPIGAASISETSNGKVVYVVSGGHLAVINMP